MNAKGGMRHGWDFFVSYTQADRAWAEWIAWVLEEDGYRALIQAWDFVPGSNWLSGMQAGTRDASRMIAVLSGAYLRSVYGSAEWQAVMASDPDGTGRKLLTVRVADCQRPGLLAGIVGVDLFGISEPEARRRLSEMAAAAESGRAKPAVAPGFPGIVRVLSSGPDFPGGSQSGQTADACGQHGLSATPPVHLQDMHLPPADPQIPARWDDFYDVDLVLRGRLLLPGPRGRPLLIAESARAGILTALNDGQSLTGSGGLARLLGKLDPQYHKAAGWGLEGPASTREFTTRWSARGYNGRALAAALLHIKLTSSPASDSSLMIRLDIQLTNPRRPQPPSPNPELDALPPGATTAEIALAIMHDSQDAARHPGELPRPLPNYDPLIDFTGLGELMSGILGTLWGPPAESLAGEILGQVLGPPAQLDLTVFATRFSSNPVIPTLDRCIDFGIAQRIWGSTCGTWTQLGPVQPDRAFLSPAKKQSIIRQWLIHLGIDNGYENVEQEVNRHEPYA